MAGIVGHVFRRGAALAALATRGANVGAPIGAVTTEQAAAASGLTLARHSALGLRFYGSGSYLSKDEVTERVLDVVKKFDKVDPKLVTPTAHFKNDLGLDSLDETEVVMAFEEEFNLDLPDDEADKIKSMADAIEYIVAAPNAK